MRKLSVSQLRWFLIWTRWEVVLRYTKVKLCGARRWNGLMNRLEGGF
ncbi:MAG: hypothetical protein ACTS6H_01235 [Candidatus Hodgkinia cicadicola]